MLDDGCPGRHCWVDTQRPDTPPRPGLLVEWRQHYAPGPGAHPAGAPRWQGRVVYLEQRAPGRWATIEEWLDADRLTVAKLPQEG